MGDFMFNADDQYDARWLDDHDAMEEQVKYSIIDEHENNTHELYDAAYEKGAEDARQEGLLDGYSVGHIDGQVAFSKDLGVFLGSLHGISAEDRKAIATHMAYVLEADLLEPEDICSETVSQKVNELYGEDCDE